MSGCTQESVALSLANNQLFMLGSDVWAALLNRHMDVIFMWAFSRAAERVALRVWRGLCVGVTMCHYDSTFTLINATFIG